MEHVHGWTNMLKYIYWKPIKFDFSSVLGISEETGMVSAKTTNFSVEILLYIVHIFIFHLYIIYQGEETCTLNVCLVLFKFKPI